MTESVSEREFAVCPRCGERMLADVEVKVGRLQQCFNVNCGQRLLTRPGSLVSLILEAIYRDCHADLVRRSDGPGPNAVRHLVEERDIEPSVIARSMVGIVGEDYDVTRYFAEHLRKAE